MKSAVVVVVVTAAVLLAGDVAAQTRGGTSPATLRITQRALMAMCVNDVSVDPAMRRWTVGPQEVRLTMTMRNEPRYPSGDRPAGVATIAFRPEPGHRYEVEVRADGQSFARRVWTPGTWTPVDRDRTTEQIVCTPPEWTAPSCSPAR